MIKTFLYNLNSKDQAFLLEQFIIKIEGSGKIYGANQIIDMLETEAIKANLVCCPLCGRGKNE